MAFQLKALHGMSIQEIARITFGWFGMDLIQSPDTDQDSTGPGVENQAVVRDLELIKDIDFLEDLDTLQELVTVLDRNESI